MKPESPWGFANKARPTPKAEKPKEPSEHQELAAFVEWFKHQYSGVRILSRAIEALDQAGIEPVGITDMVRKVDLQVMVEEDDFDAAVIALHKGLVERDGKPVAVKYAA